MGSSAIQITDRWQGRSEVIIDGNRINGVVAYSVDARDRFDDVPTRVTLTINCHELQFQSEPKPPRDPEKLKGALE